MGQKLAQKMWEEYQLIKVFLKSNLAAPVKLNTVFFDSGILTSQYKQEKCKGGNICNSH